MSKKQLFGRFSGFGRKKDSTTSTSPYPNGQQYANAQQQQQGDYTQTTNNYNGTNGQYHNQQITQNGSGNHYTHDPHSSQQSNIHNNQNHNPNKPPSGTNTTNHQNNNNNNTSGNSGGGHTSSSGKSHKHKSHSKRSNGKRSKKTERMTIETSLLSTEMSQDDVAKLLKLDTMPYYKYDDRGYIEFSRGLFIDQRYILLETLGRGTFSKVFESIDVVDKTKVAVKVIRNSHRYIEAAKTELRVLQHITNADDGRSCCIHLKDSFHWNKHPCLAFKLYGPSIYTIMAKNHYRPFPDPIVKDLTLQICTAIQFMHHLGIIFTDLKPENMVFVDGRTRAIVNNGKQEFVPVDTRIKLVDFGSAVYEPVYDPNNPKTEKFKHGYNYLIQTRHYRAPEVVLEMPWKRQVDIWSIGCVILEFLYGSMVFNTHCAIDHLNQMQKMIGKLPDKLIQKASDKAYDELFIKSTAQLNLEKAKISRAQARPLRSYFNLDNIEHQALYDLVQRTLRWEAKNRINADAILRHAYFQITNDPINNTPNTPNQNQNQQQAVQYQQQQQQQAAMMQQNGYHQQNGTMASHANNQRNKHTIQQQYMYQQQQQMASAQQQQPVQQVQQGKNGVNGNYTQQPYITQ